MNTGIRRACALAAVAAAALLAAARTSDSPPARVGNENPILQVPPGEMRSTLAEEYRVAPDRRFLKAFGDLDHLLSGRPPFTATATWRAGRWEITHDGRVLATWSDPPTWDEATASLAAYARSAVPERSTVPASEIESIDDGDLFAALRDADAKWKASHDPSLLVPASRAYALLTLQSLDWMGVGDALASKAIAVTAAAKALTSTDMSETETILAASTGYVGAAEGIARRLAETNPVRQWASDEKKIAAWARSSSSPLVQYLGQLTVAQRGNESQWLAWIATQKPPSGTIATAKTALTLHAFAEESQWTLALAGATLDEVKKGKTSRWNGDPAQLDAMVNDLETFPELRSTSLCDRFEEQLSTASASLDGPILDRDSFGAFYRAAFYTGLFGYGIHLLDSLSSAEAAADFDRVIGRPRAPLPARLSAWFVILTARKSGKASLVGPLLDLESPDILGTIPLSRTFEEVRHAAAYDDATVYAAARAFFRHIDSRPSDRLAAARIAGTILLDIPLHDRLEETAMRDGETSGIRRLALSEIAGDTAALRAIVADPAMRARDRAEAANGLNIGGKLDEKQYRAAMTPILAVSEPDQEWELQKQYAMHLADHGARAAAEAVVTSWLRDNPHAEAFTRYDATTVLSRFHLEDGDTQKAWSDVQPGLDAFKQSSVGQAAMVLEAMGRHQEARALAVRNVERYRDSAPARITLAAILWRQRQDRDAAAALVEPGYPLNSWEWRSAGSEFLKTLDNAPPLARRRGMERTAAQGERVRPAGIHRPDRPRRKKPACVRAASAAENRRTRPRRPVPSRS